MNVRPIVAFLALLAALPLVGAPVSMADWGEQAVFSVEPVERSELTDEVPVLRYETLSASAQRAVRSAVESPDGSHVVYGRGDWPDRFFYSDYSAPGQGHYGLAYDGEHYRLYTHAGGGFPFVYWLYEVPFVLYGLVLGWTAVRTYSGALSAPFAGLAGAVGIGLFALGPVFDFPLVAPMRFVGLGGLAFVVLVAGVLRERVGRPGGTAG